MKTVHAPTIIRVPLKGVKGTHWCQAVKKNLPNALASVVCIYKARPASFLYKSFSKAGAWRPSPREYHFKLPNRTVGHQSPQYRPLRSRRLYPDLHGISVWTNTANAMVVENPAKHRIIRLRQDRPANKSERFIGAAEHYLQSRLIALQICFLHFINYEIQPSEELQKEIWWIQKYNSNVEQLTE